MCCVSIYCVTNNRTIQAKARRCVDASEGGLIRSRLGCCRCCCLNRFSTPTRSPPPSSHACCTDLQHHHPHTWTLNWHIQAILNFCIANSKLKGGQNFPKTDAFSSSTCQTEQLWGLARVQGLEVAARDGGREDLGAQSQSWTLFLDRECNFVHL